MTHDGIGPTSEGGDAEWLSPSVALTRFSPEPARAGPARTDRERARYGFRVGNMGLMVGAGRESEVIDNLPIFAIPTMPPWLSGLVNLRGNLVPVFDLKLLFGLDDEGESGRTLLVVDKGDKAVAIPIDGLPRPLDTGNRTNQLPPLPPGLREHMRTAYLDNGEVWLDVDYEGLFEELGRQVVV